MKPFTPSSQRSVAALFAAEWLFYLPALLGFRRTAEEAMQLSAAATYRTHMMAWIMSSMHFIKISVWTPITPLHSTPAKRSNILGLNIFANRKMVVVRDSSLVRCRAGFKSLLSLEILP